MKALTDLLNSESATIDDWYHFAQSHYQGMDFTGADDSAPLLADKIQQSLSSPSLTLPQLQTLYSVANQLMDTKNMEEDGFQIMSWGALTHTLILENLNQRLEQTANDHAFSETTADLLATIQAIASIRKRKPEEVFPNYLTYTKQSLELIQQEITTFKNQPSVYHNLETIGFLQQEENYLKGPIPTDQKLLRQGNLLAQLSFFDSLVSDYKKYILETGADFQNQKLNIVTQLETILNDKTSPPSMKIHLLETTIQHPDNKAIIEHDSFGEKILNFIQDCIGIFFTRTPTKSEIYKAELLSLKQHSISSEPAPPLDKEQHDHLSNK